MKVANRIYLGAYSLLKRHLKKKTRNSTAASVKLVWVEAETFYYCSVYHRHKDIFICLWCVLCRIDASSTVHAVSMVIRHQYSTKQSGGASPRRELEDVIWSFNRQLWVASSMPQVRILTVLLQPWRSQLLSKVSKTRVQVIEMEKLVSKNKLIAELAVICCVVVL